MGIACKQASYTGTHYDFKPQTFYRRKQSELRGVFVRSCSPLPPAKWSGFGWGISRARRYPGPAQLASVYGQRSTAVNRPDLPARSAA
jgi:hypothetical protein